MVQKNENTLNDPLEPFFCASIPPVNLGLREFTRAVIFSLGEGR